ncbi:DUF1850 domain-containing protein [Lysinibacillus sp. BW-2-10]|uniref:DUF1850 domain-containing protein n=1 Tax=Lysinibacillus sp. BW-2-10 TaxID=2590030 RepID=UPI00117E1CB2|nr:DUF1850 domain-containing protein [Lysinibacillus sp. BW-2-10]TSI06022.1 DUF1850 domain-containing protein [Lysinibacillus sp. BW-2-10]
MKRVTIITFSVIVTTIFLFTPIYSVFSFTETRANEPKSFYIEISGEDVFQIRYTHSIHLTDVLETYEITNSNELKLVSMEYEDVAIGMPAYAQEGESIAYNNGKYILSYENKVLSNFTLYVGDIDTDLYLIYKNHLYNLKTILQRGKSYLFEVKRISLFEKWKGAVLTDGKAK